MEEADRRAEAAERRRLHSGSTLLRRHVTMGLREPAAGEPARQRRHEPALSWLRAYQRRGVEHARVPACLQLQGRAAHGARADLQGLVETLLLCYRHWRYRDIKSQPPLPEPPTSQYTCPTHESLRDRTRPNRSHPSWCLTGPRLQG